MQADLFDTGLVVDYKHLRLGPLPQSEGRPCGAVPLGEAEFSLRTRLMDCGTTLSVSTRVRLARDGDQGMVLSGSWVTNQMMVGGCVRTHTTR